ncbi:uncharacterized protein [Miscanthus floridulus]|uniref:uncharacterized protein n=1 Tax=Miscanthus floridulus TaxID=154761 RepID=UPI0034597135
MKQVGEEAPTPREAGALESGEAEAPSIVEATEGEVEAPRTSEAKVAEAGASRASKAEVADAGAPETTEAEVVEARAPRTTEAEVAEELEARSLEKSMFLRRERDVWDQLWQQKDLLANANELLSTWSVEVEDLRLRCADMKAEAAKAREKAAPLAAWIKELEEELTQVVGERDTFRS